MKEYPILFSSPMVIALRAGRKHVTRRLDPQWLKVKAGDRLWVRESHAIFSIADDRPEAGVGYRSDHPYGGDLTRGDGGYNWLWFGETAERSEVERMVNPDRWRPSIHMPRWASRILLECTEDARSEPLDFIGDKEAVLEGMESYTPTDEFRLLWNTLHREPGTTWGDNPEVIRVGRFNLIQQ